MDEVYLITASLAGKIREDFDGYVHMAREAGYQGLELFNCIYGGYGPKELKRFLADQGMGVISAHVNVEDTEGQLAYLPDTGCRYIVCPGIPVHSRDEAYRAAETLNALGEKARRAGLKYGYHNHNNDFDRYGDETVIDIFLNNTDPALVTFELDAA